MQQAMIISDDMSLVLLNGKLEEGWKFKSACPMPSSCSTAMSGKALATEKHVTKNIPTCLVIIDNYLIEEEEKD